MIGPVHIKAHTSNTEPSRADCHMGNIWRLA